MPTKQEQTKITNIDQLPGKMRQVLKLAVEGQTDQQIADALDLSKSSVKTYLGTMIRRQVGAANREALLDWANHQLSTDNNLRLPKVEQKPGPDIIQITGPAARSYGGTWVRQPVADKAPTPAPARPATLAPRVPMIGDQVHYYMPVKEIGYRTDKGAPRTFKVVEPVAATITRVYQPGNPQSLVSLFIMTADFTRHQHGVAYGSTREYCWGWPTHLTEQSGSQNAATVEQTEDRTLELPAKIERLVAAVRAHTQASRLHDNGVLTGNPIFSESFSKLQGALAAYDAIDKSVK